MIVLTQYTSEDKELTPKHAVALSRRPTIKQWCLNNKFKSNFRQFYNDSQAQSYSIPHTSS